MRDRPSPPSFEVLWPGEPVVLDILRHKEDWEKLYLGHFEPPNTPVVGEMAVELLRQKERDGPCGRYACKPPRRVIEMDRHGVTLEDDRWLPWDCVERYEPPTKKEVDR